MFDGTEDWRKIWRKTDMCFQKWHVTGSKIAISFSKVKWQKQVRIEIQNNQIDQMQFENFILPWK